MAKEEKPLPEEENEEEAPEEWTGFKEKCNICEAPIARRVAASGLLVCPECDFVKRGEYTTTTHPHQTCSMEKCTIKGKNIAREVSGNYIANPPEED